MIRRFLNAVRRKAGPAGPALGTPAIPPGTVVYAVGDVHGQVRQLARALDLIATDSEGCEGDRVLGVLLGDYIDRGEQSRDVLELLSTLPVGRVEWIFLAGNHEASMLAFLDAPEANADWMLFGGADTLANYGIVPPARRTPQALRACRDRLDEALPAHHRTFLEGLRSHYICGDYYFAHAGVRPGIALDRQSNDDLLWIREEFLDRPQWHGKCVVHGHTISQEPELTHWRIGIDTGAYAGGPLTCLRLNGEERRIFAVR